MAYFLKETAQDIIAKHENELSKICIVFPNKRAGLFFRKYIGELLGKTIWMPDIFTIESYIQRCTKLRIADNLSLIFDLFECFDEVNQAVNPYYEDEAKYTFDSFYHLGEMLLNDLNEIDCYLSDEKRDRLFENIKDITEIDQRFESFTEKEREIIKIFWQNFSSEELSKEKTKYIEMWRKIPLIYKRFTSHLKKKRIAYEGLVYKELSALIDRDQLRLYGYKAIIFIGFNSLNTVESKLFNYIKTKGIAKFYWDIDAYYINDKRQEAGMFLRNNIRQLSPELYLSLGRINKPDYFNQKKHVDLIGVPLEVGQAKLLENLLSELYKNDNSPEHHERTAIVLCDEHLLFPVLHSIPKNIEKINITMGYPLKHTSLFGLLNQYLKLQKTASDSEKENPEYYHKDVIGILRHPDVWNKNPETAKNIIKQAEEQNTVFIAADVLLANEIDLYNLIFAPVNNGQDLLDNALEILYQLFSHDKEVAEVTTNTLEDEYIYQVYTKVKRLKDILEHKAGDYNLTVAIKLLTQLFSTARIPFSGEPLEGLQVMGMLETRNLDFDNVIVLGMNEGIFPNSTNPPTFISENLRTAFHLPNIRHKDANYAYYFYRLLQRAKNITLVYNSITGYSSSRELSRYVRQLQFESKLDIVHSHFRQQLIPARQNAIVVHKNRDIMRLLDWYVVKERPLNKEGRPSQGYFSASAINTYIDCRLKFYLRYIAKLKELDRVEEEINPIIFGIILHETIEKLYFDFLIEKYGDKEGIPKIINIDDFKLLNDRIDNHINLAFKKHFKDETKGEFQYQGNQLIIREVVKRHVKTILNIDKTYAPFEIVTLEDMHSYIGMVDIETDEKQIKIGIRGIIDRVDKKEDIYRIIDYKTGGAKKVFKNMESVFNREIETRNRTVLQTFLYSMLLKQDDITNNLKVVPAIYNIREMRNPKFNPYIKNKDGKTEIPITYENIDDYINDFKPYLQDTLEELYNKDIAFDQTENENICKYCAYTVICGKE